jgi:hypothetical protein
MSNLPTAAARMANKQTSSNLLIPAVFVVGCLCDEMLVFANFRCRDHITSGAVQIILVVAVVVGGCHWVAVVVGFVDIASGWWWGSCFGAVGG